MNVGKHINSVLNSRNRTKQESAAAIGLSKQQFHALLADKSKSTVSTLKAVSTLLDVPSDLFLQDADKWFLIAAINDYVSRIDPQKADTILAEARSLLQEGDDIDG